MRVRRTLAWLVHLYTALGLVCAAAMAVMVVRGDDRSMRLAFLLMIAATAIDATDGWLARRVGVSVVLPGFDGGLLDNIVDFHTYTSLPLLLLWRAGIPGGDLAPLLLLPLLASAYGFSQVDAKTKDGFFLGFPSYWNIVALYLYLLRPPTMVSIGVLVGLSLLTFVRTPYLYPSRGGPFARVIGIGGAIYGVLLTVGLVGPADLRDPAILASLAYPSLYMALSAAVALGRRR